MNVTYITVDVDRQGQRIDNYLLASLPKIPKSLVYRWIRKGELRINKKRCKQTYKVKENDLIRVPPYIMNDNKK